MERKRFELEVVRAKYPLYTAALQAFIDKTRSTRQGDPKSDVRMVDAVWQRFEDDLQIFDLDGFAGAHFSGSSGSLSGSGAARRASASRSASHTVSRNVTYRATAQ